MDVFISSFRQMLFMFLFMLFGYMLNRKKLIPENSGAVLSKLENLLFMPCLVLNTFMNRCTIENLTSKASFILYSILFLGEWIIPFKSEDVEILIKLTDERTVVIGDHNIASASG